MDNASSAADFIQASRILKINSPLGEDQLLPERVTIEEGISSLFEIRLVARTKKAQIKPEELIGRLLDVSVEVQQGDGEEGSAVRRPFNGLVTQLNEGPPITRGLRSYAMVLRPQMWLLTRRSDCRIWMDKTSIEIAEILFSEHGIPAPDTSGVITSPPKQHYSVQWNETDFAYLSRRFEEDGLFYWFSHEGGKHKLHVADTANGWLGPSPSAQGEGRVRLAQGSSDRNHITEWARQFSYVPGQRAGADWNFETPRMVPGTMTPSLVQMPEATKRELYEYPARISSVAEAERAQKLRSQASEADHDRVYGASTSRIIETGRRFTPYEVAHPDHAYDEHVVIKSVQTVVDRSYETNSNEPEYRNEFEAVPSRVPMTPHRETRRPRVEGTQVAIVAGPKGEEIHPDQYGRIKVWFPWDRKAKKDGSDTCWVRVAQSWGGGTWGAQVIPRIGMEVMVSFIDGDPDRPVVIGAVNNPTNSVPYDLPANKTRMVMRSNTHKGQGFNEMSFEDEAGKENMFFHAQKDQTTRVLNDRTKRIDRHEVSAIGANRTVEVGGNQKQEVGGSMNTVVGGTGPMAMALMGAVQSMAGQTSGLLGQAAQIAGASGPGVAAFAGTLASSALGFLSAGGLGSRQGVVAGASPRGDAGTALAGSGSGVGDAASDLFPLPGIMNTIVGSFKSDTIGIARVEQIGVSKVTNVGQTAMENIGKFKKLTVGEEFVIECGASKFIMRKDGTVIILGSNFNFTASGPAQLNGSVVDLNKPGGQAPPVAEAAEENKKTAMTHTLDEDVQKLIDQSPTLKKDLEELAAKGWKVRKGIPGKGTYVVREDKLITIDADTYNNPEAVVRSLAHEVGHAKYNYVPDYSSRHNYIDAGLSDEGAAVFNEIKVQREIIGNGGSDIGFTRDYINGDHYNRVYDNVQKGTFPDSMGHLMIGRDIGPNARGSATGQLYSDKYGASYDRYTGKKGWE